MNSVERRKMAGNSDKNCNTGSSEKIKNNNSDINPNQILDADFANVGITDYKGSGYTGTKPLKLFDSKGNF